MMMNVLQVSVAEVAGSTAPPVEVQVQAEPEAQTHYVLVVALPLGCCQHITAANKVS